MPVSSSHHPFPSLCLYSFYSPGSDEAPRGTETRSETVYTDLLKSTPIKPGTNGGLVSPRLDLQSPRIPLFHPSPSKHFAGNPQQQQDQKKKADLDSRGAAFKADDAGAAAGGTNPSSDNNNNATNNTTSGDAAMTTKSPVESNGGSGHNTTNNNNSNNGIANTNGAVAPQHENTTSNNNNNTHGGFCFPTATFASPLAHILDSHSRISPIIVKDKVAAAAATAAGATLGGRPFSGLFSMQPTTTTATTLGAAGAPPTVPPAATATAPTTTRAPPPSILSPIMGSAGHLGRRRDGDDDRGVVGGSPNGHVLSRSIGGGGEETPQRIRRRALDFSSIPLSPDDPLGFRGHHHHHSGGIPQSPLSPHPHMMNIDSLLPIAKLRGADEDGTGVDDENTTIHNNNNNNNNNNDNNNRMVLPADTSNILDPTKSPNVLMGSSRQLTIIDSPVVKSLTNEAVAAAMEATQNAHHYHQHHHFNHNNQQQPQQQQQQQQMMSSGRPSRMAAQGARLAAQKAASNAGVIRRPKITSPTGGFGYNNNNNDGLDASLRGPFGGVPIHSHGDGGVGDEQGSVQCHPGVSDNGGPPKKCNCKKSRCLKLYCDCFASGAYCALHCSCVSCANKSESVELVLAAKEQIQTRNPNAFTQKIEADISAGVVAHKRGCNCKKSKCLKKYCECFQAGVACGDICKCETCHNTQEHRDARDAEAKAKANGGKKHKSGTAAAGTNGGGGVTNGSVPLPTTNPAPLPLPFTHPIPGLAPIGIDQIIAARNAAVEAVGGGGGVVMPSWQVNAILSAAAKNQQQQQQQQSSLDNNGGTATAIATATATALPMISPVVDGGGLGVATDRTSMDQHQQLAPVGTGDVDVDDAAVAAFTSTDFSFPTPASDANTGSDDGSQGAVGEKRKRAGTSTAASGKTPTKRKPARTMTAALS
jgi:hypothetical protein